MSYIKKYKKKKGKVKIYNKKFKKVRHLSYLLI